MALTLVEAHLDSGHDVVVPQLVADPAQLARFEEAAGDAPMLTVLLQGPSRTGDQPWQREVTANDMERYQQGLDRLASQRLDMRTVEVADGDETVSLAILERLVAELE